MLDEDIDKEKAIENLYKVESEIENDIGDCYLKIEKIGEKLINKNLTEKEKQNLVNKDDKLRRKIEELDSELKKVQMNLRMLGVNERGDEGWG